MILRETLKAEVSTAAGVPELSEMDAGSRAVGTLGGLEPAAGGRTVPLASLIMVYMEAQLVLPN